MVNTNSIKELVIYELKACGPMDFDELAANVEIEYTGDQEIIPTLGVAISDLVKELRIEQYDDMEGVWTWTTPRDQFIQRAVPSE